MFEEDQPPLQIDEFVYAGYKVTDLGYGLRPFDNRQGYVTSYLAKREDGLICVFAFAVDGFRLSGNTDTIELIQDRAKQAIRQKIDSTIITHRAEYTFEYDLDLPEPAFCEATDVNWWIKTTPHRF